MTQQGESEVHQEPPLDQHQEPAPAQGLAHQQHAMQTEPALEQHPQVRALYQFWSKCPLHTAFDYFHHRCGQLT